MTIVTIEDSNPSHVRELRKTIRVGDRQEAISLGLDPEKALFYAYKHSLLRRTAFVDGEVAAMWGVSGTPLALVGQPFLITGLASELISPLRFARIYKRQAEEMSSLFPVLENYVDASYDGAVRLLEISGFTLSGPITFNGNEFYRFTKVSY